MRTNAFVRTFAAWMITLLFLGSLATGVLASGPEGGASARATDLEPDNDSANGCPELVNDEIIYGSLMIQRSNDYFDIYHTTVSYGKVINASMQMVDYSYAQPWLYNFQLLFAYNNAGTLTVFSFSAMEDRWDHIIYLQTDTAQDLDVWVVVQVNATQQGTVTTLPGNYTLSVTVGDPIPYSGGTATGYMDARNGPNTGFYYKLAVTLPETKLAIARLQCPVNGDFDLYIYNVWPRYTHSQMGVLWQQNASWVNASLGNVEEARFTGSEANSIYYIYVQGFDGAGTFQLTIDTT